MKVMTQKLGKFLFKGTLLLASLFLHLQGNAQVNHLVISQVYGGGGNAGATFRNDFVELFNPTGTTISIAGWSVQYASATGLPSGALSTNLPASNIPAGGYFLIQMASGGAVGTLLPTADHVATGINMSASAGKIYLVNSTSLITACPPGATAVDHIGFGATANCFETAFASAGSNTTSMTRANGGCKDTNTNSTNFTSITPNPRNSSSPGNFCPVQFAITNISPASPTATVAFNVTVEVRTSLGVATNTLDNVPFTLSNTGGGAIGGTTTGTVLAGTSSVVVSSVTLSTAGIGVTLTATYTPNPQLLSPGTSAAFTVQAAVANDCNGVPGGPDQPGTSCNDGNVCTIGETWSIGCVCQGGTFQDTDGDLTCDANDGCPNDPNKIASGACGCGFPEVGQSCSDGNACTAGDVLTSCGVCTGTALPDGDSDGTCDAQDGCPTDPNKIAPGSCGCNVPEPGASCDDLNALTVNDQITAGCICAGVLPSVYWNFGVAAGIATPTTNTLPNTTVGPVSQGNNNGTTTMLTNGSVPAANTYVGQSANFNAGAAARIGALNTAASGSAFFEFTMTAGPATAFTVSQIRFGSRATGTGPQAYTLRSSFDSYSTDLATGTITANSTWALRTSPSFSLTSLPAGSITFRLYAHNGAGSPSAGTANWRIDALNVTATSQAVVANPLVGFNASVGNGLENAGAVQVGVTMDIAPSGTVLLDVTNALTGTASVTDYSFTNSTLTFLSTGTYPYTQFVTIAPVGDTDLESNETLVLNLALNSGSANLGFTTHTFTITNDDLAPIVINEVDYDQSGTDNAEWIELRNNGSVAVDLGAFKLELVNGNLGGASVYRTLTLPTYSLAAGGYYVVGNNASTPNVNLVVTPTTDLIQNGAPDAIGLRDASNNLLDALSYEGSSGAPYVEVSGALLNDAGNATTPLASIGRVPDGQDSNINNVDWTVMCTGTPGATNIPSTDTDGDSFVDCLDGCPLDPLKQNAGACGCGVPDTDADGDFVADCNDGCPADPNKIVPGACGCGNPDTDTDGDFVADCVDICPADANPGQEDTDGDLIGDACDQCPLGPNPGLTCDDNNPFTGNDLTQNDCSCAGTPLPSTTWTLAFTTDNAGSESTWQIVDATSPFVLDAGGPYASNTTTTESIVVPTGACFNLIVTDVNGMSNGTTGGWILRDNTAKRVIDNSGDGVFAGTVQPALPFCSPVGNDAIIASQCDKVDWTPGQIIIATPNAAVSAQFGVNNANSGYEFWFFNPDGSYSRRVFLTHANPGIGGPTGPTKCAHLAYGNLVTNPVPANVLLNVRVRGVVNGVYSSFGAACRFKIDQTAANCPLIQLISTPGPTFSCGATGKIVKASGNPGRIYAQPAVRVVNGNNQVANAYLFEITNTANSYTRLIGTTSYTLVLGQWVTNPLLCGTHTYNVRVRASFDGGATYCAYGAVCTVGITNNLALPFCTTPAGPMAGSDDRVFFDGDETSTEAVLTLWPNPNNGEQLYVSIDALNADVTTATVDIFDMVGHKVTTRTIAVNGTTLNTVIALDASMANGMYMVNVTAGDQSFIQRLVIQ